MKWNFFWPQNSLYAGILIIRVHYNGITLYTEHFFIANVISLHFLGAMTPHSPKVQKTSDLAYFGCFLKNKVEKYINDAK